MDKPNVHVWIPKTVLMLLDKLAEKKYMSRAALIRQILLFYVDELPDLIVREAVEDSFNTKKSPWKQQNNRGREWEMRL